MVVILNISFLTGVFWIIGCKMIQDFWLDYDYLDPKKEIDKESFIWKFDLNNFSHSKVTIVATYFAFTSLSTVGFGDYYPVSDMERLVGAFVLLFGVAIFSYIMGNFINILT